MTQSPRLFEFTFWIAPEPRELPEWSNALFEAGADDCSPGELCGQPYVTFHRQAAVLDEAIQSARQHLVAAGCRILRCEFTAEQMAGWLTS